MPKSIDLKKNCWSITSDAIIVEKVYFASFVTKEEAKQMYINEEWDDIADYETLAIVKIKELN